jgi:UDP-N-acetyl-D-galactosamine dehydrogenase
MTKHNRRVSVIGLGYVGLPVAVAFGSIAHTIGFDISLQRIRELQRGFDRTGEVTEDELVASATNFTHTVEDLKSADFFIVAVPTPIDSAKKPNLSPLLKASETVGTVLKPGDIVVYESTVYPGATEEDCVPVLERVSGLVCGKDFFVGYSPERINPGDHEHRFTEIVKIVSGQDEDTLDVVAAVYGSVVKAGVYRAASIKVAEAAKVIENTQRDLNIALMNELSLIFNRLGIDTLDVIDAASTKWNFLRFTPGLVGGHCIGVDPYYLTYRATMSGYNPQVILAGRRINDEMGSVVVGEAIKALIRQGQNVCDCVVTILGLGFKENVPDLRNTRAIDIVRGFEDLGLRVQVCDPRVDPAEAKSAYGVELVAWDDLTTSHCLVLAVAHDEFLEQGWDGVASLLDPTKAVVADVKGVLAREHVPAHVFLWRP